jgi:CBS domain-containing protein
MASPTSAALGNPAGGWLGSCGIEGTITREVDVGLQENIRTEKVRQLALREAIMIGPDLSIRDVVLKMREKSLGCVIVVDDDMKPLGMFTEAMLRHLLVEDPKAVDDRVDAHMVREFPCTTLDDPILTVLDAMQSAHHRFVVVLDEDGRVTALTGQKGLMEYIAEHFPRVVLTQPVGVKPPLEQREGA